MASARAIFQAHVEDFPTVGSPSVVSTSTWTLPTAAIRVETVTLISGANTLTPPTGATLLELIPPTTNAESLVLKGAVGDTGWQVSSAQPTVVTLGGAATRLLVAGATVTGCVLRWY